MKTKEILDLIFKSPDVKYGLVEFESIDFEKALSFSQENGKTGSYYTILQNSN